MCPACWLITVKCWSFGKEGITCRFWKGAKITEVGEYIRKSKQSTKRKTKWETNRGRESRSVMPCTHSHCSTDSDSTMLKSGLRKCWENSPVAAKNSSTATESWAETEIGTPASCSPLRCVTYSSWTKAKATLRTPIATCEHSIKSRNKTGQHKNRQCSGAVVKRSRTLCSVHL